MNDKEIRENCQRALIQEVGLKLDTTMGEMVFKPGFILTENEITGHSENGRIEGIRYEDILSAETTT